MHTKVKQFVEDNKMLEKCDRVIVGLSGGADSVCLLILMKELCEEKDLEIIAVHINHGIRGEEADADEAFCRLFCERLGVEYKACHINVPEYADRNHLSVEEAARILRYEALYNEAGENGVIAVAHHQNDQAETVLFNLVRGSKLKGAAGMAPVRDRIIRPLLCITREEIEEYLFVREQDFCTDSTNLTNEYSRNSIRNQIMPLLTEVNLGAVRNIAAFAAGAMEAEEYLSEITEERFNSLSEMSEAKLLLKNIEGEHPYIAGRLIRKAIGQMGQGLKDITELHIKQIIALKASAVGANKHIKGGLWVENTREGLLFYVRSQNVPKEAVDINPPMEIQPWEGSGKFRFEIKNWSDNKKITNEVCTKMLDYDKIKFGLQLRTRKPGDIIAIDDMGHHKKLKQYFVDEHISRAQKDETILLADGNNIVWVVGGRIGADYKITENTTRVLEVYYEGGRNGKS